MMLKSSCGDPQVTWDLGPGSMGLEGPGTGKASWWRVGGGHMRWKGKEPQGLRGGWGDRSWWGERTPGEAGNPKLKAKTWRNRCEVCWRGAGAEPMERCLGMVPFRKSGPPQPAWAVLPCEREAL